MRSTDGAAGETAICNGPVGMAGPELRFSAAWWVAIECRASAFSASSWAEATRVAVARRRGAK
jgi:hypothetical protein